MTNDMSEFKYVHVGSKNRQVKLYKFICPKCGKTCWLPSALYKRKVTNSEPCGSCLHSTSATKQMADLKSDPVKLAECRKKHSELAQKQMNEFWNSTDQDSIERQKNILEKLQTGRNKYFQTSSKEVLQKRSDKLSSALTGKPAAWFANMADEERAHRITELTNQLTGWRENASDEKIKQHRERISKSLKRIWASLSDDERSKLLEPMQTAWKDWYDNLSPEDWEDINERRSNSNSAAWKNLSDDKRKERVSNSIKGNNNSCTRLNQKFEEMFNHSILVENFTFVPEYTVALSTGSKSWDYGIFEDGRLVMLVDLDGEFYHADKCDYDGIHSREEYDESRPEFVPDGVKLFILVEKDFVKCFELMMKELMMDYEGYVDYIFKICRSMPFPFPEYNDKELQRSFKDLMNMDCNKPISLNTRVGDRIISHFHPSIYRAHRKSEVSPYDAWYDDKLLRKCIENRTIYQSYLNPNKILQGFNKSRIAQKVSVFSAGRAKLLISKYLSEYDTIFDPFSGFSGRLLGTVSLGKEYIGQDISEIHVRESNLIIDHFQLQEKAVVSVSDVTASTGNYESLFTCPPYEDKEQWLDVKPDKRTCDDWIDICLKNFKCKRYLFVVDETTRYKEYIVDTIINKSHISTSNEYIVMIRR